VELLVAKQMNIPNDVVHRRVCGVVLGVESDGPAVQEDLQRVSTYEKENE
jgi:hypothetical protein